MKVGDLVRHRRSESGMLGVVVREGDSKLLVAWNDGRISWCVYSMVEAVNEGGGSGTHARFYRANNGYCFERNEQSR